MIKGSEAQKLRPHELLWMLWFDEKVHLVYLFRDIRLSCTYVLHSCVIARTFKLLLALIGWTWTLILLKNTSKKVILYYGSLNMMEVQQTQIVFNNILIISSKFFFKSLHICQRQFLSNFFLKIHRVSKVRFMRFY